MKKILFIFGFLALFSFASKAQYFSGTMADSVFTNATTASYIKTVPGSKSNVTFQYIATNTSGTTAANIVLYGSVDGVNYVQLATDAVSATSTFAHPYNFNGFAKYKVTVVQTGTSVTEYKILVLYRS